MDKEKVVKESTITVKVGMNAEKIPVSIKWKADDNPQTEVEKACKGMLLALFDKENMDTLKIDLWTKDMQVMEMDRFFFQTLRGLADTYFRATQNAQLANEMQRFVQYFGEATEIIPKEK